MLKQILSKIKNKLILFCTALAALLLYLSPNLSADELFSLQVPRAYSSFSLPFSLDATDFFALRTPEIHTSSHLSYHSHIEKLCQDRKL